MKIIILGAGQVGSSVAESLVSEANDITVVDSNTAYLNALQERLDLRVVVGATRAGGSHGVARIRGTEELVGGADLVPSLAWALSRTLD